MLTYNEDPAQLEVYDGSAFVPAGAEPPAGIGPNVVQTVKTDTFSTTSGTYVAVTGMTATITPSSDTSKVLVICNIAVSVNSQEGVHVRLMRGATPIYLGDADGSKVVSSYSQTIFSSVDNASTTLMFVDSPGVDTATTYGVEIRRGNTATAFVGRAQGESDSARFGRYPSSITVIEVAV